MTPAPGEQAEMALQDACRQKIADAEKALAEAKAEYEKALDNVYPNGD